jgi:hypothetical protein
MSKFNYETPVGTFRTWEEAAAACERADLDPCTCIKNVSVVELSPSTVDVWYITEYGLRQKLSAQIRVF